MRVLHDVPDRLAEYSRIAHTELVDECLVVVRVLWAAVLTEYDRKDHHAKNHADHAERITHSAGRGHLIGDIHRSRICLEQGLLRGSKHRRVGRRTGEKSGRHRQRYSA